ncbi:MAG: hypothetical protein ABSG18_23085 [Steroidobacteraceae bacterium]
MSGLSVGRSEIRKNKRDRENVWPIMLQCTGQAGGLAREEEWVAQIEPPTVGTRQRPETKRFRLAGRIERPQQGGQLASLFFPGNREIFKKNREAIEHERAITERD